jgi:hypothetical protein
MSNRVVAHFLDGQVLKGASFDVSLTKQTCHVEHHVVGVPIRSASFWARPSRDADVTMVIQA